MGRDRFEHHREPCPCGKGSLVVDWTEHDVYGSSGMWEPSVDCRTCRDEFALVIQDATVILVERQEIKRREEQREEAWRIDKEVLGSSDGRALLEALAHLLDQQRSMAAAHRLLRGADLTLSSIGSFRKHGRNRDYSEYVEREIYSASQLPKVAKLVGRKLDPELSEKIAKSSKMRRDADRPHERIGDTVYRLRR